MRSIEVRCFCSIIVLLIILFILGGQSKAQSLISKRSLGSAYLPLDHWAYPVLERAIARGAVPAQFMGIRPWTRMAIADLLEQRRQQEGKFSSDDESLSMIAALEKEFQYELGVVEGESVGDAQITSVYSRITGVSGDSLRDSFHLGQTIVNDFGRPYGNGVNNVTGGGLSADYSAFTAVLSGEFQHSAEGTRYSSTVQSTLSAIDNTSAPISPDLNDVDHGTFMDTYVGGTWHGWDLSTGKESIWWGTTNDSSLTLTNNAEPMFMGRVDRTVPLHFPWIFKYLGEVRMDFFMAKMEGHQYIAGPWFHGEKISLMPTKNLEIGFARTTVWLGTGRPFSWHALARTYLSVGDQVTNSNSPSTDPGDRRGELDVRYRVPGIRNYMTVYFDSLVDDDPSPLASPHRAAFRPGFYLTQVPYIPKLDFRAEGAFTQLTVDNVSGHFFYWNVVYHDSYLNNSMLLGDWVGREGIGGQATARYWLSPQNTVEVSYRRNQLATDFIPGGGYQQDISAQTRFHLKGYVFLSGGLQYEQYRIPLLANGTQRNFATTVGFTFLPGTRRRFPRP